jgi:hypothetical protein
MRIYPLLLSKELLTTALIASPIARYTSVTMNIAPEWKGGRCKRKTENEKKDEAFFLIEQEQRESDGALEFLFDALQPFSSLSLSPRFFPFFSTPKEEEEEEERANAQLHQRTQKKPMRKASFRIQNKTARSTHITPSIIRKSKGQIIFKLLIKKTPLQ